MKLLTTSTIVIASNEAWITTTCSLNRLIRDVNDDKSKTIALSDTTGDDTDAPVGQELIPRVGNPVETFKRASAIAYY